MGLVRTSFFDGPVRYRVHQNLTSTQQKMPNFLFKKWTFRGQTKRGESREKSKEREREKTVVLVRPKNKSSDTTHFTT